MLNNFSNYGSSFGVTSQYQGNQKQYQPVGPVQSFYGQQQQQQLGTYPSSQAYHTANYRGNELGHDAGLRGDSFTPAQQQVGGFAGNTDYSTFRYGVRGNESGYSNVNNVSSQFGMNAGPYNSIPNRSSASFIGNQANVSSFGQAGSFAQGSYPSTQAYHTANYRGNQLGHDAGLRGDSLTPAQQQVGFGSTGLGSANVGSTNYGSFSYGVRGLENSYSGVNNVSAQFGMNQGPYNSIPNQGSFR